MPKPTQPHSKYGASKTVVDGITFDSKKEASRYRELLHLQSAGLITDLRLQPTYTLQPAFRRHGKAIRAITYRADFEYREDGLLVAEDVKGYQTPEFRLKAKLFLFTHPDITLRIT